MDDVPRPLPASADEFLAWAEGQEARYEYVGGAVVMQAGASRDHEQVAKRIFVSLFRQVDGSAFDVNKGDFGVRPKAGRAEGSILLPDVLVDLQTGHGKDRATSTPVVAIEVLSPSTDLAHHVDKLGLYAELASLFHYAVFSQDGPEARVWRREDGAWPTEPVVVEGPGSIVAFPEIGATLALSEVHRHLGS